MRALYRASFELANHSPPGQLTNKVACDCYRWVLETVSKRKISHSFTPPTEAATIECQQLGQGYEIEALNASTGDSAVWGFRFSHPDSDDRNVRWTVECTVYAPDGKHCQFSCSIFLARSGASFRPVRRHSSRPRIVRDVLEKYSGKGGFPLTVTPLGCPLSNVEFFAEYLQNPKRTHPVLFISPQEENRETELNIQALADHLAGVANVVVAGDNDVTWRLSELIPNQLNCYGGAVRLYWPGFDVSDSPFEHPLWTARRLDMLGQHHTRGLGQIVLDMVSNVAVFNLHQRFLTWDRLQEIARHQAIAEAKAAGRSEEMLSLFEEDNRSLTSRVAQLENQLGQLADEAKRDRALAEMYREALQERGDVQAEASPELPASSVAEAIANAQREHSDRIVFSLNSKSEENSPFESAAEVERAFNWLATTYYDSKTNRKSCPNLGKNLSETITGWHYSAHQKETTMKSNASWYQCLWPDSKNGKLWIREHLKTGTSRRPEETIRIAFSWEEKSKKVVIGFIGQHQENTKS